MNAATNTQAPSSLRLIMTLAVAGLLSGIAIIGIYESTLPTITANKARELREAVFKVLPGVSKMQALVYREGELVAVASPGKDEPVIYGGRDEQGEFIGYGDFDVADEFFLTTKRPCDLYSITVQCKQLLQFFSDLQCLRVWEFTFHR